MKRKIDQLTIIKNKKLNKEIKKVRSSKISHI